MAWYVDLFSRDDPFRQRRYEENEACHAEVDFVIDAIGLQPGDRVLDLCCGQGRHLIDLMRRGYQVVGVDLSEHMLSKCHERCSEERLEPRLIQADMRDLQFDSEFDAVIIMWNSFGYLESDADDQRVLDGLARALKPGGRLLLDYLINRDCLMKRFSPKSWWQDETGDIFLSESVFDSKKGRILEKETCVRADGRRTEQHFDLRVYTYGELEKMLDAAGMAIQSVWGGRDKSEFSSDSKAMEIVAVKD